MSQKKPSTALSKTTTLTCSSVSSPVMISFNCGMVSGPKMLSGGWSNVTRQYVGERRDSRISIVFVAGEFRFFIFCLLDPFDFCLAVPFFGTFVTPLCGADPHRGTRRSDRCGVLLYPP